VDAIANMPSVNDAAGSSPPWERWYEAHREALRRYLARSLGPDRQLAEDMLHDVYVRALAAGGFPSSDHEARPWLYRIATNLLIDHFRISSRRQEAQLPPGDDGVDPARGPEATAMLGEVRRTIRDAIERLPDAQREVFLLREYGGVSFKEIALRTGAPMGTVLARMRYALLRMRSEMEQHARHSRSNRGSSSGSHAIAPGRNEDRGPRP
jgi:RNA polymerase sigma-70 factor (ECF subfamily)